VIIHYPGGNFSRVHAVAAFEVLTSQFGNARFAVRVNSGGPGVSIHIQRHALLPRWLAHGGGGRAKSLGKLAGGCFFLLH
jgi:hypothetical protein